jgi:hypothetical protein
VALGYEDPQKAMAHVDDTDRISRQIGGKIGRPSTYVNQSGMYAMIFGSKNLKPDDSSIAKGKADYNAEFRGCSLTRISVKYDLYSS